MTIKLLYRCRECHGEFLLDDPYFVRWGGAPPLQSIEDARSKLAWGKDSNMWHYVHDDCVRDDYVPIADMIGLKEV
jgi:hypothetical protein